MDRETNTSGADWSVNPKRHGWLARDVQRSSLTYELGPKQLSALRLIASNLLKSGRGYAETDRSDFQHSDLNEFLTPIKYELMRGKGLVFLHGIPVDDLTPEELRMVYWGIGTHFGTAISQSRVGNKLGEVTPQPGGKRPYVSDTELELHTDYTELAALLCVQPAKLGGDNVFVSSLAIWDIIERERPEFISVLKTGFTMWRYDEYRDGQEPFTTTPVPIFGESNGLRSVYWVYLTADASAKYLGQPLTQIQKDCIRFLCEIERRDELKLKVTLDRGEAVFFNNFEVLHSRTAFVQWEDPAKTRLLLRLWLQSTPPRPIPKEMMWRENLSGLLGHDPDPKYMGQEYPKPHNSPSSEFINTYFHDMYNGKMTPSELLLMRLGEPFVAPNDNH